MTIVGYEESVYTLVEEDGYLEICVVITRNGSRTPFIININTTNGTAGIRCSVCNIVHDEINFPFQTQRNSYKVFSI